MLDWTHWAGLLAVIFILWLLIRVFLKGSALRAYDSLPARCTRVREQASPEHQQTLLLLAEASVEIRAAPRKRRVAAIRQFMARGFVKPLLLTGDAGYRVLAVDAGGVPGEWVLAPNADPNRRLLYLHGGNFLSGCPQGHRVITTELARVTGAVVLALLILTLLAALPLRGGAAPFATPSAAGPGTIPGIRMAICNSAVITGKVRHVSLSGNDGAADGSATHPYRTLYRAVQETVSNDTILVHGGTYQEPNEIRLRVPGVTIRS
ncbi:MAG: DUF1565 domain-containing protein [Candidatus Competibacteraceae bacterium]